MDQELAKQLFKEGGILVFLGVPAGTEFGIDMKSWNTGEKFRGVKMIPPGPHFIFYSSVNDTRDTAPRTGFFYNFNKSEIVVRKWDKLNEDISADKVSQEEVSQIQDNLKFLDGFLGPYPFDIYEKWKSLTININVNLIEQLTPLSGIIRSALEMEPCSDADRPRGNTTSPSCSNIAKRSRLSDEFDGEGLPFLKAKAGTDLQLTILPKQHFPSGSTPSDITQHSLDSCFIIDTMVAKYKLATDLVGELEFCFICFLVGHSLEAFEHWKTLVSLFCSSELAIKKHRRLYDLLVNVLEVQIIEIPEEFLADIVTNNNFIYVKLRNLFRNIESSDVDGQLKSKVNRFKIKLTEHFLWDFEHLESEDEEDAPVVVEIT